jgi:carbonic anhydrase
VKDGEVIVLDERKVIEKALSWGQRIKQWDQKRKRADLETTKKILQETNHIGKHSSVNEIEVALGKIKEEHIKVEAWIYFSNQGDDTGVPPNQLQVCFQQLNARIAQLEPLTNRV